MSRKVRVEYPGASYHMMSRRNRRENIFEDFARRGSTPTAFRPTAQGCRSRPEAEAALGQPPHESMNPNGVLATRSSHRRTRTQPRWG